MNQGLWKRKVLEMLKQMVGPVLKSLFRTQTAEGCGGRGQSLSVSVF
jgi:hypothetical protein